MTDMKRYMTDRRKYERPTMKVVEIQQRGLLMTSGEGLRGRDPYDPTDDNPFGG
jgi:hypothetical protein